jgi:hypothetical protein
MPWVGFEHTIPVFERAKTFHVLDRGATVIGRVSEVRNLIIYLLLIKKRGRRGGLFLFATWIVSFEKQTIILLVKKLSAFVKNEFSIPYSQKKSVNSSCSSRMHSTLKKLILKDLHYPPL